MRLLIITRKVDLKDASPAAPTYHLVEKIGKSLEKLYVITWQESDRGDLPENIEIISLSGNKWLKIFAIQIKLIKILPKVNGVFCHQNPEYTILAAPLAKLFRKKIITWYTHGSVSLRLKLVNWLTDKILTASEKSCRLENRKKIEVTGHGIDIDYFNEQRTTNNEQKNFVILSIGRISLSKDYETLIEAVNILVKKNKTDNLKVQIIGGPALKKDKKYFDNLKQLVKDKDLGGYIKFLGPVPHSQILPYYQDCDLFINLSQTGSIDKAVLEAMACQTLVLTSNDAFIDVLKDKRLMFENKNPQDLGKKIIDLMNLSQQEKEEIGQQLREIVVKNHNLDSLVDKIITQFS